MDKMQEKKEKNEFDHEIIFCDHAFGSRFSDHIFKIWSAQKSHISVMYMNFLLLS